jgi:hypothetical protein
MQFITKSISVIARTLLRLALFVVGAVFVLILLCVGLLGLLYVLLKALLTGRKPVFVTSFMRFQQASQQFQRGNWNTRQSAGGDTTSTGEVIEGQAIEVRDDTALPHKPEVARHE